MTRSRHSDARVSNTMSRPVSDNFSRKIGAGNMNHPTARLLTVFLGAIPASLSACLALLLSFMAGDSQHNLYGLLVLSPLAVLGAFALWKAALGPLPIRWPTTLGLLGGLLAMAGFHDFPVLMTGLVAIGPMLILLPWIVISPLIVAACHLLAALISKLAALGR